MINHRNSGGTLVEQFANWGFDYGSSHMINVTSGPTEVNDGDYFELVYQEESDTSITIEGDHATRRTFLAIRVIGMEPV